jgi:hypothetical protein
VVSYPRFILFQVWPTWGAWETCTLDRTAANEPAFNAESGQGDLTTT